MLKDNTLKKGRLVKFEGQCFDEVPNLESPTFINKTSHINLQRKELPCKMVVLPIYG